eukprot:maker-scaffold1981_size23315-snap-gene-0.5 protein:Tk02086 transcript:maker-scaffold1981_size23315-snap-gene-0.5-mRNA-1 annotation:"bcs-1 protein"
MSLEEKPDIAAVALKLPSFTSEAPERWFYLAESKFRLRKIVDPLTKHDYVLAALPPDLLASFFLSDSALESEDPFKAIKSALLARFQTSSFGANLPGYPNRPSVKRLLCSQSTIFALLALATVVLADNPPPPYRPAPAPYQPEPKYEEPAQYQYAYAVKDEYSQLDFNANEEREGYATSGSYQVLLPDGRTQTVTYSVNGDSGYVADVQYAGEAKYEPYQPKPAPNTTKLCPPARWPHSDRDLLRERRLWLCGRCSVRRRGQIRALPAQARPQVPSPNPPTIFALLALAAVVLADNPPPPYRPAPAPYQPEPKYEEPAQYQYAYAVKDEYSQLDFNANEEREGYGTSGSYQVLLPDGRTQTVTYSVNGDSGYVADVQYAGEAKYEPYQPKPAPNPPTIFALLALAAVVLADNPPPPYRPAPAPYQPEPKYEEPAQYQYAYAVKDEYSQLDFNANEEREGYGTSGSYQVLLPDGRTQTVTYSVNGDSGYVADTIFALLALAAVVLADNPPPPYRPAPAPYQPEPKYEEPAQYQYAYAVKDEYSQLDFNANEEREGYATSGSYQVLLPDGRTQTVTYSVNGDSGYVADV